jgi:hypothetical protein
MTEFNQPPRTAIDNHRRSFRRLLVYNETNQTIPAHAIMQLKRPKVAPSSYSPFDIDAEPNIFFAQRLHGEQLVWSVSVCDDAGASRQNPAEFVFNLQTPIPRFSVGEATQDYPARVLHDGRKDRLPNWRSCGPVRGQWWVYSGPTAFTCQTHDATKVAGARGVHTVWVYPRSQPASVHGIASLTPTTVLANSYIPLSGTAIAFNLSLGVSGDFVIAQRAGLYAIDFAATVSSTSAPRGATLSLTLYRRDTNNNSIITAYRGQRLQDIEEDQYGTNVLYTAENVAFPAIQNLATNEGVGIRNTSGYPLGVSSPLLRIIRAGDYIESSSSGNSGNLDFGDT